MTNTQTCLHLLTCARITILTAWPNIRKSLLLLMLLAELFSKSRAEKLVMPPWAWGWSGRDISQPWLRDANEPGPLSKLLHAAFGDPVPLGLKSCLSLSKGSSGQCVTKGPLLDDASERGKNTILLVRLCSGCMWAIQCELPATCEWAACLITASKCPTSPGGDFWTERKINPAVSSCIIAWTVIFGVYLCLCEDMSGEGIGLWSCALQFF